MADEKVLPIELEGMERLRRRVLELAAARDLTQKDMERAARVAHSTYDGMWERGTVTIVRLERIAKRLGMDLLTLLGGEGMQSPVVKPAYVEDRLEAVERELRSLRQQLRNLTPPKK